MKKGPSKDELAVTEAAEGSSGISKLPSQSPNTSISPLVEDALNGPGPVDEEFWAELARSTGGTWK